MYLNTLVTDQMVDNLQTIFHMHLPELICMDFNRNLPSLILRIQLMIRDQHWHYSGVIMGAMASQILSFTIVDSTVYSVADPRKHLMTSSWIRKLLGTDHTTIHYLDQCR